MTAPNVDAAAPSDSNEGTHKFTFDHVLTECTQDKFYRLSADETVRQFTAGYNGTIFAYGQTGSGKTFSMLGPEEVIEFIKSGHGAADEVEGLYGIIPRAIRDLFVYVNAQIEQEGSQF